MSTAERLPRALAAGLLIGGTWRESPASFERVDPADPARITGRFAAATAQHVSEAYATAARAQKGWGATSAQARGDVLRRAGDLLEAEADVVALRLVADMGKAVRDARAEVLRGAAILRYYAGEVLSASGEVYPSADPDTLLMTLEQPLGVVALITPWNFPIAIPVWKLAPALGFGNAIVWKPAEAASGSAVALAEILQRAGLPDGVCNLLTGHGRELSAALTGAPELAGLSFTGSAAVGRALREATAARTVKLQLELGGKNPAVVLADADLPDAALQVARGAMLATGQRCTATSRAFVDDTVYDDFVALLLERVAALRVGDPYDETTDVGPLASQEQWETVKGYLDLAGQGQVQVLTGGEMGSPADGFFAPPTVLAEVDCDSPLLREEIFGPVVCVMRARGLEDALRQANDTEFGLSSAVFTRDIATALSFARRTESGLVHVNRETAGVEPHVPFGGLKASSSLQREQGTAARLFYTNTKTVYLRPRAAS